jgi:hypothetical protein
MTANTSPNAVQNVTCLLAPSTGKVVPGGRGKQASVYEQVGLSGWLGANARETVATVLGLDTASAETFPDGTEYIATERRRQVARHPELVEESRSSCRKPRIPRRRSG